jgi:hypothetical protein
LDLDSLLNQSKSSAPAEEGEMWSMASTADEAHDNAASRTRKGFSVVQKDGRKEE